MKFSQLKPGWAVRLARGEIIVTDLSEVPGRPAASRCYVSWLEAASPARNARGERSEPTRTVERIAWFATRTEADTFALALSDKRGEFSDRFQDEVRAYKLGLWHASAARWRSRAEPETHRLDYDVIGAAGANVLGPPHEVVRGLGVVYRGSDWFGQHDVVRFYNVDPATLPAELPAFLRVVELASFRGAQFALEATERRAGLEPDDGPPDAPSCSTCGEPVEHWDTECPRGHGVQP